MSTEPRPPLRTTDKAEVGREGMSAEVYHSQHTVSLQSASVCVCVCVSTLMLNNGVITPGNC